MYHKPELNQLLRTIWTLTCANVPFDIIGSAYGFMPKPEDTPSALYQDCLSVLHYAKERGLGISQLLHPRDGSVSIIETYLDLIQPASQEDLIGALARHYNGLARPIKTVSWDASFTEPSSSL